MGISACALFKICHAFKILCLFIKSYSQDLLNGIVITCSSFFGGGGGRDESDPSKKWESGGTKSGISDIAIKRIK